MRAARADAKPDDDRARIRDASVSPYFCRVFRPMPIHGPNQFLMRLRAKRSHLTSSSEKASLMVPPSRRAGGRGHRRRREPQGGAAPICRRVQDRPRRRPRPRAQFLRRVRAGCADPHRDGAHHRGAVVAIRGGLRNGVRARPLRGRPPTGYPAQFRESLAALRNRTASRPKQSSRPPPPIRG